jgi:ribosomal protein L30E
MKAPQEYFNLYIESIRDTKTGDFKTVVLIACSREDIYKYIEYIKDNNLGIKSFGEQRIQIVLPEVFRIFDFTNSEISSGVTTKEYYVDQFRQSYRFAQNYLRTFQALGNEVTSSFNINLEEILERRNESEEIITTTATTTEEPPETTTLEGVTTQEPEQPVENDEDVEKISSNVKGASITTGNLNEKIFPFTPIEFNEGILDSTVEPAFKVEKIASVFANHLKNLKHEDGQMIGVFGQWGRGKSYFVKEVYKQLERISDDGTPFLNIKFQAWKYQNTPSIWAYLFETFVKEYLDVNWWDRIWRTFHLSIVRKGNWKTWGKSLTIIAVGIIAIIFIPYLLELVPFFKENESYENAVQVLGGAGVLSFLVARINSFVKFANKPALSLFNSLSKVPSFRHVLGIQEEIHKELVYLIKGWKKFLKGKRLLLFIDDLDRCSHHSLIEIVDSLRVMLDDEEINRHVLVLMALDEDKLQRVVYTKYNNLFKENIELETIAIEYLDKLFISAIKLYPISNDERAEYIKKIATQINSENIETSVKKDPENEEKTNNAADTLGEKEGFQSTVEKEKKKVVVEKSVDKESQQEVETFQNLNESEVNTLAEKIKQTNKELTPRQIRIVVYRYLLARNLWLAMAKELEFKTDDVLDEILRLSGYSKEDRTAATKINPLLFSIVRMVVAY